MGMMINRRRVCGGKSLPYDAEIEYLESSGTQYIDLPFGFYDTDEVYTHFSLDIGQGNDVYINSPIEWNTNNNRFGMGYHNNYCMAYGGISTNGTKIGGINDGKIHNWEYKNHIVNIIDLNLQKDLSYVPFGSTSANIRLFYGYNTNSIGKIVSYKHVKNGVAVVDFIPVRVGTIGFLYDKISGQLFGNNGTGDFILGPDK